MRIVSDNNVHRSRSSVRAKLLRSTVTVLLLVTIATLGCVAVAQYRTSRSAAERTEQRILKNQREKGSLLVSNQAIALRSLALDNAFGDVGQLIRRTVKDDEDVIYGSFVDATGTPWIVVTPTTSERGLSGTDAASALAQVPGATSREPTTAPRSRTLRAFGVRVEEHAIAVVDGSDYLGTVRYGISLASTEVALRNDMALAKRSLAELLLLVGLLGVAGMALGAVAIRKIASRITQPLAVLAQASEELANGNRSFRAEVSSGDELEQLATTFNNMASANQRAMTDLEVKTAEALEASRLKSEFLANMSHEIRTPMNGILGVVRLVHKMPLEGKLRRYIETIDSSASALLTIINDVLDFSKMEAGKYTLKNMSCDLRTIVQEVCELLATRAHDRGVELICRLDPTMSGSYEADPDRFRQIVNNLVGNAIKFTERGEIFVDVRVVERTDETETLRVAVIDTGIGIAQSDLPKLFDAFSQVDGSMVRKYGGTGLGLAISKRLVDMMGGTIGVKSALGEGSEFYFTIALGMDASLPESRQNWSDGKTALIVERNPRWQDTIAEHLRVWGIRPCCFASGKEALAHVQRRNQVLPDVVVAGAQITDMPFEQFVRELRLVEAVAHVPIVALYQLGAGSPLSDIEKELAAQLTKPLRFSELYNVIQRTFLGGSAPSTRAVSSGTLPIANGGSVLVVDDNEINRFVAQEMLEQMGYTVDTADDGEQALARLDTTEYMIVLMDCQMPVMDGYTATRELRKREQTTGTHTTVVALTAHALSGEREKVLAAGMDDYLSKPVRPASLDKMIRRYARTRLVAERVSPSRVLQDIEPERSLLDASISRSRKLIQLFLKNMPTQLVAIRTAIASGTATDVRAHAHKSKGSCLALGATTMASAAERLQRLAETGDLAGSNELLSELEGQLKLVTVELEKELEVG